jgi:putative addiction module killer protein
MYQIERTVEFERWLAGLRDQRAREKIATRIVRIQSGLLGDWKAVSTGVSEIRIDYGPGYRLYFTLRNKRIVILLCGSDKKDQDRAIRLAKALSKTV